MTTIRDISKLANVSIATVSRVLNGGRVKKETKEKVVNAMKELNYTPNIIAQSLNYKKTKTIALIIPDITNPYFSELARAVEDVAKAKGYTVFLFNSDDEKQKTNEYFNIVQQKYVDGMILATKPYTNSWSIPVVVIDRVIDKKIDTVVVNNRKGGRIATNHLIEIGCKRIAHIRGPKVLTSIERCMGYLEVVSQYSWFNESFIAEGNFELECAQKATEQLLTRNPEIDGIFAGNDLMAVGALKAIKKIGRKVPEEIAIIGFDGINLSKYVEPTISTIEQPIYELGAISTNILLDKISNKSNESSFHELAVKLIKRESTNRRAKGDKI